MRNFNFKPLVNVRTQKDEFADIMVATSVTGAFRIPPKVATQLDVKEFETLSLFSDTNEETQETFVFIAKGHAGTPLFNTDGTHQTTENRGIIIYDENDPSDGALVRATTEGSKMLTCTSAGAWKALGGSKTTELELEVTELGVMDYPLPSGKFVNGKVFELTVANTREIAKRKTKGSKDVAETTDVDAEAAQAAGFQEEEV